jgi:hypothetical protein
MSAFIVYCRSRPKTRNFTLRSAAQPLADLITLPRGKPQVFTSLSFPLAIVYRETEFTKRSYGALFEVYTVVLWGGWVLFKLQCSIISVSGIQMVCELPLLRGMAERPEMNSCRFIYARLLKLHSPTRVVAEPPSHTAITKNRKYKADLEYYY